MVTVKTRLLGKERINSKARTGLVATMDVHAVASAFHSVDVHEYMWQPRCSRYMDHRIRASRYSRL